MALGYGFFPGGDPRSFTPDKERNSPRELENWCAACEAWNRGDQQSIAAGCVVMPDGRIQNISQLGMGTYMFDDDDEEPDHAD